MDFDPDSTEPTEPPPRRFGPVTLLASLGGLVMGLIAAVYAQNSSSPFTARGILVTFICIGVSAGVGLGMLVERPGLLPRPLGRFPWHWFRFNMRFVIWVTTGLAVYLGVSVAAFRWSGLNNSQFGWSILYGELIKLPLVVVYLLATLAFINRRHLHPRASKVALTGLGLLIFVAATGTVVQTIWMSLAMGNMRSGWTAYAIQGLYLLQSCIWVVGFVLVVAAGLVDREKPGR
jgi:magnesium-transporting ATPase (P-type)